MTEQMIAELEAKGFKRWTKGNLDRLYINAAQLGLVCQYYKTGNIRHAEFNGESISNSQGYRYKSALTTSGHSQNRGVSSRMVKTRLPERLSIGCMIPSCVRSHICKTSDTM